MRRKKWILGSKVSHKATFSFHFFIISVGEKKKTRRETCWDKRRFNTGDNSVLLVYSELCEGEGGQKCGRRNEGWEARRFFVHVATQFSRCFPNSGVKGGEK